MGKMGKVRGWKKSLAAFLLLASLLGLLAGCQPKPEDILKRAIDKTNGAESYRSVMTGQIGVGSQGISATVEFTLDLEAILTPMKAKGKVKIDMGGFAEEMEVYIDEDYTRLGMGGYWLRAPREEENVKTLDLMGWMTSYKESVEEDILLDEAELGVRT